MPLAALSSEWLSVISIELLVAAPVAVLLVLPPK